eukprot:gene3659-6233_t
MAMSFSINIENPCKQAKLQPQWTSQDFQIKESNKCFIKLYTDQNQDLFSHRIPSFYPDSDKQHFFYYNHTESNHSSPPAQVVISDSGAERIWREKLGRLTEDALQRELESSKLQFEPMSID